MERVEAQAAEVMIDGTDIPVHMIAALYPTLSVTEIAQDYPSLAVAQIHDAIAYASLHPHEGRPYPAMTLKRALAHLSDMGVFEAMSDDGSSRPAS